MCLQIIGMTMNKTRFNRRDVIPFLALIRVSNVLNARVRGVMTSKIPAQNAIPISSFLTNNATTLRM